MPWRGPLVKGEVPTLGWAVADWIEANCVVPDGDLAGDPFLLSDAQREFLLGFYQLEPDADERMKSDVRSRPARAFSYTRGGLMVMPQKWGKGPFAAAVAIVEAYGPVRFDGWDAKGEPVGRPWATPIIAITAQSEEQSKNVWGALLPMIQLGDLVADIPDTGLTRINVPGGGLIVPVTASAKSRQGARITFAVQDEVQGWAKTNGGEKLADTQYRSLSGMGGRFLQTGNAWDPAEHSVAQTTFEIGVGVFKQMATAGAGSIRNKRERMRVLRQVYVGAPWVDPEIISMLIDEFVERGEVAQAERYFFNRIVPGEDRAFDAARFRELARPGVTVPDGALITIGVDGARYFDAIAAIATEVKTGYQWTLGIWERPPGAAKDYEHPFDEVDGVITEAFKRWNVWRVYADPGSQYANISPLVDRWQGRWGNKRIVAWMMNLPKKTAYMLRRYVSAMMTGDLTHNGEPIFAAHVENARRNPVPQYDEDGIQLWTISKEAPSSPLKIDAAAAGALSWEARADAIASGKGRGSVYDARLAEKAAREADPSAESANAGRSAYDRRLLQKRETADAIE